MKTRAFIGLAALAAGVWLPPNELVRAEVLSAGYQSQPYLLDSGLQQNPGTEEVTAFKQIIQASAATPIMRIHFTNYNLGQKSYVKMISQRDQGWQRLDTRSMPDYQSTSALFNGDKVQLELHVAPGETGIFVQVDQIIEHCNCPSVVARQSPDTGFPETLCGADSRVASTDFRVGRISGCTAWLVSNGAVLAAGHCGNPGGLFEVNVPASQADGTPVASNPNDQYPVNPGGFTRVNNGLGDDYLVFRLLPNSTTGTRAHLDRGFFRMSRETPAVGATIRITGCGVDNTPPGPVANCCAFDDNSNCTHPRCNSSSRTLQTATGGFVSETVNAPNDVTHRYQCDTEPANSGSPIIWAANGFAIGIHTNGGCNSDGSGSNSGTSFENDGLEGALGAFPGANTRYLDWATYPNDPAANGTIFQPYHTLPTAAAGVPSGGRISVVEGSYTAATGNTGTFGADGKSYLLEAPVGSVTFGN